MKRNYFFGLGLSLLVLTGCASTRQSEIYPMSYDQTYQTALEALDQVGSWKLLETDQLNGLILFERGGYFMPHQTAKVVVKRLEPFRTRVELYEDSSSRTHEKFFEAIDQRVENRALTYPR